ncbi:MAG: aldolase/citrate lyase family protein [Pseudomonadota bacterium]
MSLIPIQGSALISAWTAMPEPLMAELYAGTSADAVTLDMQHGLAGPESVMRCVGAVKRMGKPAIVRVPVDDWATVSRCLDFGADAIIAPMVNTAEDAAKFAGAAKYPPVGVRSYGPSRAVAVSGHDNAASYRQRANLETKTIAMIETATAVSNLNAIVGTEGIDALFVGPADLSFSLSGGSELVPFGEGSIQAIKAVVEAAKDHGKWAAIYCYSAKDAKLARGLGFDLIALGNDAAYVASGLEAMVGEARI